MARAEPRGGKGFSRVHSVSETAERQASRAALTKRTAAHTVLIGCAVENTTASAAGSSPVKKTVAAPWSSRLAHSVRARLDAAHLRRQWATSARTGVLQAGQLAGVGHPKNDIPARARQNVRMAACLSDAGLLIITLSGRPNLLYAVTAAGT